MVKMVISILTIICFASICLNGLAANTPEILGLNQITESKSIINAPTAVPPEVATNTMETESQENPIILTQDSGANLTDMNITFTISPTYGTAQAVRFTPPKPGWNLKHILVMATDGWNASNKELPKPLPFAIEVRDENYTLLYHYQGIQLPYFTNSQGVRMATIDVPAIPMIGVFFVCFYGYGSISLAAELKNATKNSYYYEPRTAQLFSGVLPLKDNQTIPVNWLIRVAGQ